MAEKDVWITPRGMIFVSDELIKEIRCFPIIRKIPHCDSTFQVSPFDFYGICPKCETKIKLRGFSANSELPDLFDAVFEWMLKPEAEEIVRKRQIEIIEDTYKDE